MAIHVDRSLRWRLSWQSRCCICDRARLPLALPILLLWIASPAIAWWISRPYAEARTLLTPSDALFLRRMARQTWAFFERFVGRRRSLAAAGQRPGTTGCGHRTSHVPDQHGPGTTGQSGGLRLWLPHCRAAWSNALREPSPACANSSAIAVTSSTGTTRSRCSHCSRCTSRRWTVATWWDTCSRCARDCWRCLMHRCCIRESSTGWPTRLRFAPNSLANAGSRRAPDFSRTSKARVNHRQ